MRLRPLLFWVHLSAGVVAGLIIAVMSVTGAALAFEKELLAWAERDVRRVELPATPPARLPLSLLAENVRRAAGQPAGTLTVDRDPTVAVVATAGRDAVYFVNPYTGAVRAAPATGARAAFRRLLAWHRWLGADETGRAAGRAVTGACNAAFVVLVLTGFYLWWPRSWSWRVVRGSLVPRAALRGKARDWNWHAALGFWSAPVLLVLSGTGVVLSYRWAGNLPYTLTRTAAPASPAGRAPAGGTPSAPDLFAAAIEATYPNWQSISLRAPRAHERRRDAPPPSAASPGPRPPPSAPFSSASVWLPDGAPRFAPVQVTLDATGRIDSAEGYEAMNAGRKLRSWLRFLHTGEALGVVGKTLAAAACLAALVLVWTGIALAARRAFRR